MLFKNKRFVIAVFGHVVAFYVPVVLLANIIESLLAFYFLHRNPVFIMASVLILLVCHWFFKEYRIYKKALSTDLHAVCDDCSRRNYVTITKRTKVLLFLAFSPLLASYVSSFALERYVVSRPLVAAPWDVPQYRNPNLPSLHGETDDIISNGTLRMFLRIFHDYHAIHQDNRFPVEMWTWPFIPRVVLTDRDRELQQIFVNLVVDRWESDNLSLVMPFNTTYLRNVLERTSVYFAHLRFYNEYPFWGFYARNVRQNMNFMVIGVMDPVRWDPWGSAHHPIATSIHEIGRALGLEDSLTNLFSESFTAPRALGERFQGRWDYDSSFDRVLKNIVGAEAFWHAAFTSNEAYGRLWDQHLSHIVPFDTLMLARGVMRIDERITPDLQYLRYVYQDYVGDNNILQALEQVPGQFYSAFSPIGTGSDYALQSDILAHINSLARFAETHNIAPFASVNNFIIYDHITGIFIFIRGGLAVVIVALMLAVYLKYKPRPRCAIDTEHVG